MNQKEVLAKIHDDIVSMCGQLTYHFNEPADDKPEIVAEDLRATLRGYLGEEMRLNPEQMEIFKEAASVRHEMPTDSHPGVIRMTIEMDSEGRLSVVTHP